MSIKVQVLVWEHSALKGPDLLAMVAIADQAGDDGEVILALDTLRGKLRIETEAGIKACLRRVCGSGELVKIERFSAEGRQMSNAYRIDIAFLISQEQQYYYTWAERSAARARGVTPVTPPDGGVPPVTPRGVTPVTPNRFNESFSRSVVVGEGSEGTGVDEATPTFLGEGNSSAQPEGERMKAGMTSQGQGLAPWEAKQGQATEGEEVPGAGTGTPPAETAREALEKVFRAPGFLETLLTELPDRGEWLALPPPLITAAHHAARREHGANWSTPLIKALDSETRARRKGKPRTPQAPAHKTGADKLARLATLKGD